MRAIFKSIVGETDKKESFSDNLNPLGVKLFCERLKITIFLLKNYAETHYFVGKKQLFDDVSQRNQLQIRNFSAK